MDDSLIDIVAQLPVHPTLRYAERDLAAITHLIIHHSADEGTPQSWAQYHVHGHGWPGVAYSAAVMRDGTAYKTNNDSTISYHAGGQYNPCAVAVVLQGDLSKQGPTGLQVAKSLLVVRRYVRAYGISSANILGHGQVMMTECPGALWLVDWLRAAV